MVFANEVTISDMSSVSSLLLVFFGGIFAYFQWRKKISLQKANYINDLTDKIRTDSSIRDVVYLFEYGNTWYTENFHDSGDLEYKIDTALSYFSYICYLKKQRILSKDEFLFFKYEVERAITNPSTLDYLYNLYHFSRQFNTTFTFQYLLSYADEYNLLPSSFYDIHAYKSHPTTFHRYLNFDQETE